jgi:hypothetical protein
MGDSDGNEARLRGCEDSAIETKGFGRRNLGRGGSSERSGAYGRRRFQQSTEGAHPTVAEMEKMTAEEIVRRLPEGKEGPTWCATRCASW